MPRSIMPAMAIARASPVNRTSAASRNPPHQRRERRALATTSNDATRPRDSPPRVNRRRTARGERTSARASSADQSAARRSERDANHPVQRPSSFLCSLLLALPGNRGRGASRRPCTPRLPRRDESSAGARAIQPNSPPDASRRRRHQPHRNLQVAYEIDRYVKRKLAANIRRWKPGNCAESMCGARASGRPERELRRRSRAVFPRGRSDSQHECRGRAGPPSAKRARTTRRCRAHHMHALDLQMIEQAKVIAV